MPNRCFQTNCIIYVSRVAHVAQSSKTLMQQPINGPRFDYGLGPANWTCPSKVQNVAQLSGRNIALSGGMGHVGHIGHAKISKTF